MLVRHNTTEEILPNVWVLNCSPQDVEVKMSPRFPVPTKEGFYWRRERSWTTGEWLMTYVYQGDDGLVFDGLWEKKIPHTNFDSWNWQTAWELPCDQREPSEDGYYWRQVGDRDQKDIRYIKRVGRKWVLKCLRPSEQGEWSESPFFDGYPVSVRIPDPDEITSAPPVKRWVIRAGGGAAKLYTTDPIYSQFVEAGSEPTGDSCHLSPPVKTGWHWLKRDDEWRPVYVGICDGRAAWHFNSLGWNYDLDKQVWGPYIPVPWVESKPLPRVTPNYPPKPGYNWFRQRRNLKWVPAYVLTDVFVQFGDPDNHMVGYTQPWQWGGPLPSGPTA